MADASLLFGPAFELMEHRLLPEHARVLLGSSARSTRVPTSRPGWPVLMPRAGGSAIKVAVAYATPRCALWMTVDPKTVKQKSRSGKADTRDPG